MKRDVGMVCQKYTWAHKKGMKVNIQSSSIPTSFHNTVKMQQWVFVYLPFY